MDIRLNTGNPRFIKDEKFKKLCNSIKEFPKMLELRPIVVDSTGMILGGNMRYRALLELGMEIKPEWVKEGELTEEEARRFIVEDNIGFGDWDWDMLGNEYEKQELEDWGMDVDKWKENDVIEDEVPEVTENPVSRLGEVYQLGRHRLMCGDSTKIEDVEKLMDGKNADMVFTDPPYGMNLDTDYTAMNGTLRDGSHVERNKHDRVIGDGNDFNVLFITNIFNLFDYCKEIFLWGADYYAELIPNRKDGSWVVWDKTGDEVKDKGFGSSFELCWSKQKHRRTFARIWWQGIFGVKDDQKGRVHPTQKPTHLAKWFFDRYGKADDIVLDLFLGSGSTLIACEQTNRICYGMEIDPRYIDVIRKRYAKFIGKEGGWEKITPKI